LDHPYSILISGCGNNGFGALRCNNDNDAVWLRCN
jgi:hypothetical protein